MDSLLPRQRPPTEPPVELEVVARLPELHITVRVTMMYFSAFPYEVHLVFHDNGEDIPWSFAKELLEDYQTPQGLGDVQVYFDEKTRKVAVRLDSPQGTVLAHFPRSAVDRFIGEVKRASAFAKFEIDDDELTRWLD